MLALYASQWTASPDDCVQEALVELARQPRTPDSPVAWLYRVVKRRALNAARGDRRRREREQAVGQSRVATAGSQATDFAEIAELLAQLDGPDREAVVLRLWGGLTFAEIADTLGLSTATAHRRYEQALETLRQVCDATTPTEREP
ncbi:ECF RNA polymerase sigma factor SigK [Posidoniimonas polymericola]|uniref:ECF RNA polymerase sigma factor SigK n=1 Tax=Posidoniimonas polymericola TaxID=2528002 RepID=A0A5C5YMI1_9BACT|nr:ECF RNA polymerase sigma factor SigK [Posidoniimonas polymericola]